MTHSLFPGFLSVEPFAPHPWTDIAENRVFPRSVNALWYSGQVAAYEKLTAQALDAWRIAYQGTAGKVTGIAALPKDTNAQSRLPLVIFCRGGNHEYGRLTVVNVVFPFADLTAAGYGVLASNYRGNDGGKGADSFGGDDVEDVLELIRLGRQMPWWDGKNIYLLGWSRGGMMVYRALKEGAQVQAAATLAGLADVRMTDAERRAHYVPLVPHANADLEQELTRRSALAWPEAIETPLMLLHGDADRNIDVAQSQTLAFELDQWGHENKLVIFPAGTHSLSRYQRQAAEEILAWFAAHRAAA